MRKVILLLLSFLFFVSFINSQRKAIAYPEVGQPCPNFTINNIAYFSSINASVKDFKGKWLVIDFWNKWCSGCIEGFPETNALSNEFKGNAEFLLMGYEDPEQQIRKMYANFRKHWSLTVPCAFDSLLFKRLDIGPCPYIIVLDPDGIVRCKTHILTRSAIEELLKGGTPNVPPVYRVHELPPYIDINKPFLIDGNGGPDSAFVYRSLLAKWSTAMPQYIEPIANYDFREDKLQEIGVPLIWLYNIAYLGKKNINAYDTLLYGNYFPWPLLEVKDSTSFKYDFVAGTNFWCYSLSIPSSRRSNKEIMEIMRDDLKHYFRYSSQVEKRRMPYWRLVSLSPDVPQKLKSNGDSTYIIGSGAHLNLYAKNLPIRQFINILYTSYDHTSDSPIFINETGMDGNIDIHLDCILTDIKALKQALNKNGLDLVSGTKEMKVLVIRDSEKQ